MAREWVLLHATTELKFQDHFCKNRGKTSENRNNPRSPRADGARAQATPRQGLDRRLPRETAAGGDQVTGQNSPYRSIDDMPVIFMLLASAARFVILPESL